LFFEEKDGDSVALDITDEELMELAEPPSGAR
jgi:hypothetical protein